MVNWREVTISFDTQVLLENRDSYWAARIEPLGMIVYADTRPEVEQRVNEAVEFFFQHSKDVPAYLDFHKVSYDITEDNRITQSRRSYPVSGLVRTPVSA